MIEVAEKTGVVLNQSAATDQSGVTDQMRELLNIGHIQRGANFNAHGVERILVDNCGLTTEFPIDRIIDYDFNPRRVKPTVTFVYEDQRGQEQEATFRIWNIGIRLQFRNHW